ncbi:phosphoribosylglycinamide formyltransferase [Thiolapillus brandeum]|uniref:Phosphoribosylglycinamide formyltransferase n=1 Tax=Thiolapillus brandeum TaxID=1076588 RepID=A0A7U6GKC2_9GAMM|nr:phosphoribosylglycinamide formyltransferase [Thiolapillus brandeum]BAO45198.1 phosphoribosylglycinamide formyltransferase [Thiolapillus brandeum]
MSKLPIVVLISGGGTNLQAIIDAARDGLPVDIRAVISNQPDAYGLQRAKKAGIPTAVLDHRDFDSREAFDQGLAALIDSFQPGLVLLAGFMRILTPAFVRHYQGRMLNIHPSLLPKFQGLHTHQRALDAAEKEHGASIHFVTEELDGGPIIIQARVPVLPGDDAEKLAARVLEKEHIIYPLAVRWIAEGRLSLNGAGQVVFDNQALATPLDLDQVTP